MPYTDFIEAVDAWMNVLQRDKQALVERLRLSPEFADHFVSLAGCDVHWIHVLMDKSPETFHALKICFRRCDTTQVDDVWMEGVLNAVLFYSTMRRKGYHNAMTRTLVRLVLVVALLEGRLKAFDSAEAFLRTCDAFLSDEALNAFYAKKTEPKPSVMTCCGWM